MIVRWPGKIEAGTTSDALICQVDFCPSFAALLNTSYEVKDGENRSMLYWVNLLREEKIWYWKAME